MIVANQMVEVKWNSSMRKYYTEKGYAFTNSGDTFLVDIKDLTKGSKSDVKALCDWCENEFTRPMQSLNRKNQINHFCSNDCQHKHRTKTANEAKPSKECKQCEEDYKVEKWRFDISNFCSVSCLAKWQSENFKGKSSPLYVERFIVKCDWCDSDVERTAHKLKSQEYNFCNINCKQNWHREVLVKTDKFLDVSRQTMLSNLSEGKIKMTETVPHTKITEVLVALGIPYLNEKIVSDYSFDIYLPKHDLYIEINGGYWHCDNRLYSEIKHSHQVERIIQDKRKRTYMLNNLNKNILYLWEHDINKNLDVCVNLIEKFIEGEGLLENYHSMNYQLEGSKLLAIDTLHIPYMEESFKDIAHLIDLSAREKATKFDKSKYITFKCNYCDNDKTQLLVSYNLASKHYCSIKCNSLAQQIGNEGSNKLTFDYECASCDKDLQVRNFVHQKLVKGTQKNIFCSKECKHKWKKPKLNNQTKKCL